MYKKFVLIGSIVVGMLGSPSTGLSYTKTEQSVQGESGYRLYVDELSETTSVIKADLSKVLSEYEITQVKLPDENVVSPDEVNYVVETSGEYAFEVYYETSTGSDNSEIADEAETQDDVQIEEENMETTVENSEEADIQTEENEIGNEIEVQSEILTLEVVLPEVEDESTSLSDEEVDVENNDSVTEDDTLVESTDSSETIDESQEESTDTAVEGTSTSQIETRDTNIGKIAVASGYESKNATIYLDNPTFETKFTYDSSTNNNSIVYFAIYVTRANRENIGIAMGGWVNFSTGETRNITANQYYEDISNVDVSIDEGNGTITLTITLNSGKFNASGNANMHGSTVKVYAWNSSNGNAASSLFGANGNGSLIIYTHRETDAILEDYPCSKITTNYVGLIYNSGVSLQGNTQKYRLYYEDDQYLEITGTFRTRDNKNYPTYSAYDLIDNDFVEVAVYKKENNSDDYTLVEADKYTTQITGNSTTGMTVTVKIEIDDTSDYNNADYRFFVYTDSNDTTTLCSDGTPIDSFSETTTFSLAYQSMLMSKLSGMDGVFSIPSTITLYEDEDNVQNFDNDLTVSITANVNGNDASNSNVYHDYKYEVTVSGDSSSSSSTSITMTSQYSQSFQADLYTYNTNTSSFNKVSDSSLGTIGFVSNSDATSLRFGIQGTKPTNVNKNEVYTGNLYFKITRQSILSS